MSVGESRALTLSHGGIIKDLSSVSYYSDNPGLFDIQIKSGTDFTFQLTIVALEEGTCDFLVSYGDIFSNSVNISVLPAESIDTTMTEEETLPIPQTVYTFIVNKSSKVIHRFGCSHAPENGTTTTLFYEWLDDGYRKCSFCFD